jgi:S-formylglutathione hydrolase FrmB
MKASFCGLACAALLCGLAISSLASEVSEGVTGSNICTETLASKSLDKDVAFNVLLPSDYDTSTRRYPTLYLLHGYGDTHTAWSLMTDLSGYASQYKIIIVMPNAEKSFYVNSVKDSKAKFEDMIMKDLMAHVDSHYRTIPLPRSRAVAGLSMGGYGAVFLGLKHHDKFAAIGTFSGAVSRVHITPPDASKLNDNDRKFQQTLDDMFGAAGSKDRDERDPFKIVENMPLNEVPYLYIACGGQDFLLEENRMFVDYLSKKKITYEYHEVSPRVHSWDFWNDQLRQFLDCLRGLKGFSDI